MLTVDQKTFPVSWDQLHRDSRALAWRLVALGPFKGIVAITRGGLVPAAVIARELDVRLIDTICIVSYRDDNRSEEHTSELQSLMSISYAGLCLKKKKLKLVN